MISGNKNEERCIRMRKKASEITKLGLTPKNSTNEINRTPINPLVSKINKRVNLSQNELKDFQCLRMH